ncbi:MAG: methyltransferase domain-containing protein [Chloroflexota bacterium]|nr:methyltransferase domain-containing protein [Chloroflexota bacterium]
MTGRLRTRLGFLGEFVRNPRELGSVTPSSRFLTRAVVGAIDFGRAKRVIELGPGTGVFTRALLERLTPDGELLALDTNQEFVELLRREIPDRRLVVVCDSAERLADIVAERGWDGADVVVSGIPYSLLPRRVTASILRAAARTLRPGGLFVGYQYSPYLRPFLKAVFGNVAYRFVLRNVPPAFVYTSRRRAAAR